MHCKDCRGVDFLQLGLLCETRNVRPITTINATTTNRFKLPPVITSTQTSFQHHDTIVETGPKSPRDARAHPKAYDANFLPHEPESDTSTAVALILPALGDFSQVSPPLRIIAHSTSATSYSPCKSASRCSICIRFKICVWTVLHLDLNSL